MSDQEQSRRILTDFVKYSEFICESEVLMSHLESIRKMLLTGDLPRFHEPSGSNKLKDLAR